VSPDVTLDRLVAAVGRDLQAGIDAADEASRASDAAEPFVVADVELTLPFDSRVETDDATLLVGVGDGDGRLTLRYRPVPAAELTRLVAEPPELVPAAADRLVARLPSLTPAAAARLVDAGLDTVEAVAATDRRRLADRLAETSVDVDLVAGTAALAALGATPATAELLASADVTPAALAKAGADAAFDRLVESVERHPDRVPPGYRVDYAELDALAVAATE
jgi:hypothetical protein